MFSSFQLVVILILDAMYAIIPLNAIYAEGLIQWAYPVMIANPAGIPSRTLGSLYDKQIYKFVEQHRIITPQLCAAKFYPGRKYSLMIAQKKLRRLYKKKRFKRFASDIRGYYVYHIDPIRQWEHAEMLCWTYLWVESKLAAEEKLVHFETEKDYGFMRPDAVIGIQSGEKIRYIFIEIDRAEWRNEFDKVPKYCRLFEEKGQPKDFPMILIVTNQTTRLETIKEKTGKSEHPLKWMAKYLPDLVKEVGTCLQQDSLS